MPLDWEQVKQRYGGGAILRPTSSGRELTITRVDESAIEIRSSLWTKTVEREHLERAVALIESDRMSGHLADFVEEYGRQVTTERRTLAAHLLVDLGFVHPGGGEET